MKYASSLLKLNIDERIRCLRKEALSRGIPVAEDETLNYLLLMISAVRPKRILEIGTAVGLSSAAMLLQCPTAQVVTIEVEEERYLEAKKNFENLGLSERATCYLGDAGEILTMMDGCFDFIFLDGPKAQYEKYLFDLKRLMHNGQRALCRRCSSIRLGERRRTYSLKETVHRGKNSRIPFRRFCG